MAKESLTAAPLSNNDILALAGIFKYKYERYCADNPSEEFYVKNLTTLVGLGFTAVMEDGAFVLILQPHLSQFLNYFYLSPKDGSFLCESLAAAKIIAEASHLFQRLYYPDYYEAFETMLKKIMLSDSAYLSEIEEESIRLLQLMVRETIH